MTTLTPILHQFWIFSAAIFINKFYNVAFLCIVLLRHVMCFLSTASTSEETTSPQTVGTTSPPQTVGTISPSPTIGTISPSQTVGTEETSPPQTVGTASPPQSVGTEETSPPQSVGTEETSPPQTVGTEETSPPQTVGTEETSPPQTVGTIVTTGTVPVSSTQPTNNPSSDGTTTTLVIIVVAVVIILVVIVVGVVILVVIFRAKKRKQKLVISKLQNVKIENQDIEMKLKQEETIEKEANSSTCLPPYAEIQTETQPKSEELIEYLNLKSTVIGEYSEIELEQADSKHTLPSKLPRQVNISDPISEEIQCNPVYQDIDQQPSSTSVQEAEVYTVPDTTSSPTVGKPSVIYETVYSEPIQPSLFTDVTETPSYSDSLKPYAPIYTLPINLPKSKEVLLKVFGSNIRDS